MHYKNRTKTVKLNRIKGGSFLEKGISQTWLAKQLDKSFSMVNAYACNRIQPNFGYSTTDCRDIAGRFEGLNNYKKIGNNIQAFLMLLLSLID